MMNPNSFALMSAILFAGPGLFDDRPRASGGSVPRYFENDSERNRFYNKKAKSKTRREIAKQSKKRNR